MAQHKDKLQYMCHRFIRNNSLDEVPFVCELLHYSVPTEFHYAHCPVDQQRDLGVFISSDLSRSPHIRTIADKAQKKAAWVLNVFCARSPDILLTIYKSMVHYKE